MCVAPCTPPPTGNCPAVGTPKFIGTPITRSYSGHYFDTYNTSSIPLLGQSYEYLCHVCAPGRDATQCTLNTFHNLFGTMQQNRNNVIRLEAIFNHSPARSADGFKVPFCDEQPYMWNGNQWDLTMIDPAYLANLDAVVCDAFNRNINVEVTLFNPWDGDWTTGPFYYVTNTVKKNGIHPGFKDRKFFASFDNPAAWRDDDPVNQAGRTAQILALQKVVHQLKKYPNVIWEIANEPDFFPSGVSGITPAQVFAWEQVMISYVVGEDPSPTDTTKPAHLIQLNGHTVDTFAWTPPPTPPPPMPPLPRVAGVESAHYTFNTAPGYYGALALVQSKDLSIIAGLASMPVGFNEDIGVPDLAHPTTDGDRADSAVRSEALEFIMHGGALFDGYSQDSTNTGAMNLSHQLGYLANLLDPQGTVGVPWLDGMVPADCNNSGNWCSGITPSGNLDEGDCHGSTARIYWSTMQQPGPYLGLTVGDHLLYVHHGVDLGLSHSGYRALPCTVNGDPTKGYHLDGLKYSVQVTGCYFEYWQDPVTGLALHFTTVDRVANAPPAPVVYSPTFAQDVVLLVALDGPGSCSQGQPLVSSFSYVCNHLDCSFNGSGSTPAAKISAYTWRWGDGTYNNPSSNPQATHSFATKGKYVVSLTVADPAGDFGVIGQQLSINRVAPSPSFAASCNQLSCTFDGSGSTPGAAPISLFSWTFGDAAGANGAIATGHTYAGGGSYNVTLTLTDGDGVMASIAQTVALVGPPVANFTFNCSALTCAFDASSTTGDSPIVTYAWNFGDGGNGTGVAPSHTYGAGGSFTVTLTATDSNGQAGVARATVTPDAPPTASFTVSCTNRTCTVHTTSSDPDSTPVSRWLWNWGDGTPTIEPTTPYPWADQTHTYAASGRYTITHTVYDTGGQSGSLQLAVLADTAPVAANDTATTDRDVPVTIDVLANDSDPDGDPLSLYGIDLLTNYPGASYQVIQLGGRWAIKVTPPNSFVGTITFTYLACDNWGLCASRATVTLTVKQWTVIVDAIGQQFFCAQNGSIRIPLATLLANDYDSRGDPLTIVAMDTSQLMGTLDCVTDPTACTYRAPINGYGLSLFTYTVSDPAGHHSTAPVRIYVGSLGHPPTASDIYFTAPAGTGKLFTINDVWASTFDQDGDTLAIGVVRGATAYGSLSCTTPMYSCTYTPNPGFVGTDRFSYTASDGINPPVSAFINVLTLPNPTPTFDVREDLVATGVNQQTYFSYGALASNDYEPSGYPITVTSTDATGLAGSLTCDSFGCSYVPNYWFQGTTGFRYTATNGHGATDTAFVKIRVGGTDQAPVIAAQTLSTPKNTQLKFSVFDLLRNSYDPDNDSMNVSVYAFTATLGTLTCTTPNYWCTYTPNANVTGTDVIRYVVTDGAMYTQSTVSIKIQ